eukprot:CAMPEP_0198505912 /NCGR_PEP_ID=MMETSP1462-20131121/11333_1 /TAXON_ID=1333877 /ORGANISM="Brandtodinium nutriculum, Strain RCC3387" /LENGTH=153 /DNA_ID=CAMNT_0044235107 /DNA_START=65 /DNA_END=523 /DNA_ORIENTATION=-
MPSARDGEEVRSGLASASSSQDGLSPVQKVATGSTRCTDNDTFNETSPSRLAGGDGSPQDESISAAGKPRGPKLQTVLPATIVETEEHDEEEPMVSKMSTAMDPKVPQKSAGSVLHGKASAARARGSTSRKVAGTARVVATATSARAGRSRPG